MIPASPDRSTLRAAGCHRSRPAPTRRRRTRRAASLARPILLLGALGLPWIAGCGDEARASAAEASHRVLVLGFDGMDPDLLGRMIDAGRMPNMARLARSGSFMPLATSMPPQSPVAWANFISGSHPGKHQIYDFIHRDPAPDGALAVRPVMSISSTLPADPPWYNLFHYFGVRSIPWGADWRIPLTTQVQVSNRRGDAFWDHLLARGIRTVILRVPANYPPDDGDGSPHFCCLSGMGTPDVLGTEGEFTKFDERTPSEGRTVGGGRFVRMTMREHRAVAKLIGPDNFLRKPDRRGRVEKLTIEFEVVRDPQADAVTIAIDGHEILLMKGEWSDWLPIRFETGIPGAGILRLMTLPTRVPGMLRFYLRQVHPTIELYTTPINIDPIDPVNPISTPHDFARRLAEEGGRYYTTGIPQDNKALRSNAIDEDEFLQIARRILDEREAHFRDALRRFDRGLLFVYFGETDQLAHVFWRDRDPGHPGLRPGEAERYGHILEDCYEEMDRLVGEARAALREDDTLIVMSDHGFASFRRGFNLNTWLVREGYMTLYDPQGMDRPDYALFLNVDWSRTRAYALGINSLYVNLAGREKKGVVPESQRRALLEEIAGKLAAVRDDDGSQVVQRCYVTQEVYPGADPRVAPDLLIGYARNYRASWETALGGMPRTLIDDNTDRWSGDHCIAAELVPGIIVSSRPIVAPDPRLEDVAPTILAEFGIGTPASMTGRPLFAPAGRNASVAAARRGAPRPPPPD